MDRKNIVIAVLCILLIFSASTSFLVYQNQRQQIERLSTGIEEKESIIEKLISEDSEEEKPGLITASRSVCSANVVAVRSDTGLGVIGKVQVEIKEGNGRILMNTNPFVEPDTQNSVREAVKVAEEYTNTNISDEDIVISFDINGTLIGGPSAGAAITVATVAAIEGKEVREDVAITGTVEEGGNIGKIGGVFEKAKVAEKNGIKLFLVPKGQKEMTYYEKEIEEAKILGFTLTKVYYSPKEIDLGEYMKDKMEVKEVSRIGEVMGRMVI
jgi:predicted S18 family serine protease